VRNFLAIAKRERILPNIQFLREMASGFPWEMARSTPHALIGRCKHMETPAAVLKDIARVTKIGGRIVACEPDWETFVLSMVKFDDSGKIAGLFRRSIRNPFIGESWRR